MRALPTYLLIQNRDRVIKRGGLLELFGWRGAWLEEIFPRSTLRCKGRLRSLDSRGDNGGRSHYASRMIKSHDRIGRLNGRSVVVLVECHQHDNHDGVYWLKGGDSQKRMEIKQVLTVTYGRLPIMAAIAKGPIMFPKTASRARILGEEDQQQDNVLNWAWTHPADGVEDATFQKNQKNIVYASLRTRQVAHDIASIFPEKRLRTSIHPVCQNLITKSSWQWV